MPMLELQGVCKTYGEVGSPSSVRVLDGIDLRVESSQALAVVGPSGCGKSTLLNIIGGLDRPTSGSVAFDGHDLATMSDADLARFRNQSIGFVFQQHHLLPQCTVLENVLVPTLAERTAPAVRAGAVERAESLLARVGLEDRRDHRPGKLSGGEAQRVAVVRALINQPRLLLADEPTGSLDEASAQSLGELLIELRADADVTLIVVTHSRELAARMGSVHKLEAGHLKP